MVSVIVVTLRQVKRNVRMYLYNKITHQIKYYSSENLKVSPIIEEHLGTHQKCEAKLGHPHAIVNKPKKQNKTELTIITFFNCFTTVL